MLTFDGNPSITFDDKYKTFKIKTYKNANQLNIPRNIIQIHPRNIYKTTTNKKIFLLLYPNCSAHTVLSLVTNFNAYFASLTLFFPMFPFDPPENIRKPKVF